MKKNDFLIGIFRGNKRGFGFVEVEDMDMDFFIPPNVTKGSMNGDTVSIRITDFAENGQRAEAKVTEILKRSNTTVIGTFQKNKKYGFVVADDMALGTDIYIPNKKQNRAKNGDKVITQITKYPEDGNSAEGQIIEVLGSSKDGAIDLISVMRSHNYKNEFPKEVIKEANILPEVIHKIDERVDLRGEEIFTIDGDDTKDIDDAVSLSKEGETYVLGVHIADVSHYVRQGTALDKEAAKRGTSVYLIDTVIPMLPKKLSNGICSLNPGEDRYALSIQMKINKDGKVLESSVFKSVIRSNLQMTYSKVYSILEEMADFEEYRPHVKTLKLMKELATILITKKASEGSIDFNMPETKIILDEKGTAVDIKLREMTIANRIIEEFMIIANESIAEKFFQKQIPFIYRIHEMPEQDRIDRLNNFLLGINYPTVEKIENQELKKVIDFAKGKEEEKLVSIMVLRTMQLAKYSNENIGHFGLASKYYCHFTSPIRRYPDLFIHRVISEYLANELSAKAITKYKRQAVKYAEMSSDSEQEEEEAERDLYEIKKCEYMQNHIGETYDGVVSGVTSFGVFVELPNTVEGLLRVDDMHDDYYDFDELNVKLIGRRTGKEYKMMDKIKVRVISANKLLRRIDFAPENGE